MKIVTSSPNSAPANASAEPHWPAPVSVVSFFDAGLRVVPSLRHRGVRLVRARRRDAFVLVVDLRRRAERFLEPVRAIQRRWAPHAGRRRAPAPGSRISRSVRDLLQDQRPSGTAARGRRGRPAASCRGAAPAAAASADRPRCCTSDAAACSRRAGTSWVCSSASPCGWAAIVGRPTSSGRARSAECGRPQRPNNSSARSMPPASTEIDACSRTAGLAW